MSDYMHVWVTPSGRTTIGPPHVAVGWTDHSDDPRPVAKFPIGVPFDDDEGRRYLLTRLADER